MYSRNRRELPGALSLSALCGCIAVYSFGYAMELTSRSLEVALFWNGFQYMAIPFISFFALVLALKFSGKNQFFENRKNFWFLSMPAILILFFRFTNDWHHMFYTAAVFSENNFLSILQLVKGPLHTISILYILFCAFISIISFVLTLTSGGGTLRKEMFLLILAMLMPPLSAILNGINMAPIGIDFSALTLSISSFIFLSIFFKWQWFEPFPLGREKVFHYAKEGILIIDRQNKIIDYNQAAKSIFDQLDIFELPIPLTELNSQFNQLLASDSVIEFSIYSQDRMAFYSASFTPVKRSHETNGGGLILLTDISNLVATRMQLEKAASIDALTGSDNRRAFYTKLNYEHQLYQRYSREYSIIMLDIDYFKVINDSYGHLAGDAILIELVNQLKTLTRNTDSIARFGGDEFIVMLPETDKMQAVLLGQRILKSIQEHEYQYNGSRIQMTVSLGISSCIDLNLLQNQSMDETIRLADEALFKAKEKGRNRLEIL